MYDCHWRIALNPVSVSGLTLRRAARAGRAMGGKTKSSYTSNANPMAAMETMSQRMRAEMRFTRNSNRMGATRLIYRYEKSVIPSVARNLAVAARFLAALGMTRSLITALPSADDPLP